MAITLNETNFDREVKQSPVPVLVGFSQNADLSVPNYKCCNVEARASAGLAKRYGVRDCPTVLLFDNGEVVDTIVGAVEAERLVRILN